MENDNLIESQSVNGDISPNPDQNNNTEEVIENFGNDTVAIYVTKVGTYIFQSDNFTFLVLFYNF